MAAAAFEPSDETVRRMLLHIASSGAIIKSQQLGEEEISSEEKCQLLLDMWQHNPVTFLERFYRWLREDDLECFDDLSHGYEVNFYLREVRKRLNKDKSAVSIRNRRYEALKKLTQEGKFFSDDEMKARDPLMFEQLIGQYLTDEERHKPVDMSDLKFSSILTNFIDEQEIKELYGQEKDREDDMMEEEDSDEEEKEEEDSEKEEEEEDSDEDEDEHVTSNKTSRRKAKVKYDRHGYPIFKDWEATPATEAEKAMMRQEFITYMHQKFLSGKEDFDYSTVDDNAEYDSIDIRTQDEQESYFDDEDPENVGSGGEGEEKMGEEEKEGEEELEEWETYGNDMADKRTDRDGSELPMESLSLIHKENLLLPD